MRNQIRRSLVSIAAAAGIAAVLIVAGRTPTSAQAPAAGAGAGNFPRTSWDKKPDFNGIWQTMNSANWNLEDHEGAASPVMVAGVWLAQEPGLSVVEGGTIPYKPEALAKREENRKNAAPGKT